jgi:hypothetical protein
MAIPKPKLMTANEFERFLVYTEKRLVTVLTASSEDILKEEDTLTGGDLLPGFTLPVKSIFPL